MKTTLDIPDPLLREARKIAARERTTLRRLRPAAYDPQRHYSLHRRLLE